MMQFSLVFSHSVLVLRVNYGVQTHQAPAKGVVRNCHRAWNRIVCAASTLILQRYLARPPNLLLKAELLLDHLEWVLNFRAQVSLCGFDPIL